MRPGCIALVLAVVASAAVSQAKPSAKPRVLLIGDSISIGYTRFVKQLLAGKADVHRVQGNAGHTGMGLAGLPKWLAAENGRWDVIHFNWGLWDLCYRDAKTGRGRDKVAGKLTHTPAQYAANLKKIVGRLQETGADLVWATTTPVPPGEQGRKVGDDGKYNAVARKVMLSRGVGIDDLHRVVAGRMAELGRKAGDVHFTKKGSRLLARQVANSIERVLRQRASGKRGRGVPKPRWEPSRKVVFKKASGVELSLHVFEPDHHKASDQRPAIVFFFGGGWNGGTPAQFFPHCEYLATRGMVAISAEYRVKRRNGTTPFECVMDGKSAVSWVRANASRLGIDPDRIAAGGGSAGGHVAAAVATVPGLEEEGEDRNVSARPNALVLFNPVYDNGPDGYGYERVKARYTEISPAHNIHEGMAPAIAFLGTKDRLIPVATARSFQKKMRGVGSRSELYLYDGRGHGFFNHGRGNGADYRNTVGAMDVFLASLGYLEGAPTIRGELAPRRRIATRPNILWITCEDISPHIGCYGDSTAVTPNIDRLARQGVLYRNAFATIGVCAPARSTLITGMYPPSIGSSPMRCSATLPRSIETYSESLRKVGYYCTNRSKTDYNFRHRKSAWDASNRRAHWRQRGEGQPFFAIINFTSCHESKIRQPEQRYKKRTAGFTAKERHDPSAVEVPPYHPDTPEVRRDWARYADMITFMDKEVGATLAQLDADGLAEDTIVFFYSDHGAGMPRSKRWLYDSSTRVPMIIRFPKKFAHLAPGKPGSKTDRLVSFVDFAPTVLNLCRVEVPAHMQGHAFLGKGSELGEREYVYGFRDRMDERFDMIRSVRGKRFKYIRNFMPHIVYAQHISYMYQMPTMQVWQRLFDEGKLRGPQRLFFLPKPMEELYDTDADPHEVANLAGDPAHRETLTRMRGAMRKWMQTTVDLGFLPEADLRSRFGGRPPYKAVREDPTLYPFDRLWDVAELANRRDHAQLSRLVRWMSDDVDPAVRYWGAVGLLALGERGASARDALGLALKDSCGDVRVVAAAALCGLGHHSEALPVLTRGLEHQNEWVRLRAANVLDDLDWQARPVRPALEKARKDKNRYVQRVIAKALRDLKGG